MKLKRFFAMAALLACFLGVMGQIHQPVSWSFASEKNGEKHTLLFTASIESGWHLYAAHLPSDDGPIPTSFQFDEQDGLQLSGDIQEPKPITEFDPNFQMELGYFKDAVTFRQDVLISTASVSRVKGSLEFMVCNESMCLPPETVPFDIRVGNASQPLPGTPIVPELTRPSYDTAVVKVDENRNDTILVEEVRAASDGVRGSPDHMNSSEKLEEGCGKERGETSRTFWGIFFAGLLGGFLALLTPCVFPMIPLTVSYFTKQQGKGLVSALVYALSIIVIYVGLGFIITKSFGSDALNAMASNAYFNLAFFVIFVVFAISFFGAFEITLPSKWVNKADRASDRGGLLGIFFMAFTLSLVSFSCTGPIIGTLLVEAAVGGSNAGPVIGMTGFAVALALPFALFAAFPSMLKSLPKSGGWLNTVKVTLGFLELALALKFLSNVDLAYHWGWLKREIFIALWIVIFGTLGLYLLGWIRLKGEENTAISVPRLLVAIICLSFTTYLLPGLWGAPLKLISGFPPPTFYQEWNKGSAHCPHNLNCYHDYEEARQIAENENKPLLIDFTGWSCVNCRKMEDNVWSDPKVLERLSEDYILVSLYVDDKTPLPENEQYTSSFSGKYIKTVGNKWSDFQASTYHTNSQPYYVLLDHREKLLAQPVGYTPEIESFIDFLQEGTCRFEKRNP